MSPRKQLPLLLFLLPSCLLAEDPAPLIDLRFDALTQYNHRGMVQNETGVLQGEMALNLATRGEGEIDLRAWANMDLDTDTGDAWFPDGHGGEVTESQYVASFSKRWQETDFTLGIFNYNLLNGSEFQAPPAFDPRGPTTEVFARVARDVFMGIIPSITVHYDIDEVEDVYIEGNLRKDFQFGTETDPDKQTWKDRLSVGVDVNAGYSGEDHSEWAYGLKEGGFADLRGTASVAYQLNAFTTLRGLFAASTILDEDLRDWFELAAVDIDPDNFWGGLGVTWSF